MKNFLLILLLSFSFTSCVLNAPTDTSNGEFLISTYDENGHMKQFWSVKQYTFNPEDMSVTFTVDEVTHTVSGSYEINELLSK